VGNIIFGNRLACNNSAACLFFSISWLNLYSIWVSGGLSPPQAVGNLTGDPEDQIQGKAKQVEAAARHAKENLKDDLKRDIEQSYISIVLVKAGSEKRYFYEPAFSSIV